MNDNSRKMARIADYGLQIALTRNRVGSEIEIAHRLHEEQTDSLESQCYFCLGSWDLVRLAKFSDPGKLPSLPYHPFISDVFGVYLIPWEPTASSGAFSRVLTDDTAPAAILVSFLRLDPCLVGRNGLALEIAIGEYIESHPPSCCDGCSCFLFAGLGEAELVMMQASGTLGGMLSDLRELSQRLTRDEIRVFAENAGLGLKLDSSPSSPDDTRSLQSVIASSTSLPLVRLPKRSEDLGHVLGKLEGKLLPSISLACHPSYTDALRTEIEISCKRWKVGSPQRDDHAPTQPCRPGLPAIDVHEVIGRYEVVARWLTSVEAAKFVDWLFNFRRECHERGSRVRCDRGRSMSRSEVYATATTLCQDVNTKPEHLGLTGDTFPCPSPCLDREAVQVALDKAKQLLSPFTARKVSDLISRLVSCVDGAVIPYLADDMLGVPLELRRMFQRMEEEKHAEYRTRYELEISRYADYAEVGMVQRYGGVESVLGAASHQAKLYVTGLRRAVTAAGSILRFLYDLFEPIRLWREEQARRIGDDKQAEEIRLLGRSNGFVIFGLGHSPRLVDGGVIAMPDEATFSPLASWVSLAHEFCHDVYQRIGAEMETRTEIPRIAKMFLRKAPRTPAPLAEATWFLDGLKGAMWEIWVNILERRLFFGSERRWYLRYLWSRLRQIPHLSKRKWQYTTRLVIGWIADDRVLTEFRGNVHPSDPRQLAEHQIQIIEDEIASLMDFARQEDAALEAHLEEVLGDEEMSHKVKHHVLAFMSSCIKMSDILTSLKDQMQSSGVWGLPKEGSRAGQVAEDTIRGTIGLNDLAEAHQVNLRDLLAIFFQESYRRQHDRTATQHPPQRHSLAAEWAAVLWLWHYFTCRGF